ncbi:MAG: S46 family peptidase [Sphingobacteriia bacterium]|nr:S46 family peptidase [Sphingobacteriia bacterium]
MKYYFKLLISIFLFLQPLLTIADGGMWIPMLLEKLNEKEMRDMGMKITAKDIYDINNSSMKDAIFLFGGGCTASAISEEGLILTNHHCGYGAIQRLSTIENDMLTNGFWAMNRQEELPSPGLTVTRLVRMEDVTNQMLNGIEQNMTEKQRSEMLKKNSEEIVKQAKEGTHYEAFVRPFFYGNEFYLFVNEVFKDVRLVGAPPSSIGNFGGDTDNWMWPRHTGDFSLFRIYVDKNNQPAEFSPENVPYKPKSVLPVSLKGLQEDDFTFVFGFPGRTEQYLPSYAIEMITQIQNPARIDLRRQKLDIYESFMNQDALVKLQYSNKHKGLSNAWKKWIGENNGIRKLNGIEKKQQYEIEIQRWIENSGAKGQVYGQVLDKFKENYEQLSGLQLEMSYMIEAGLGIEIVRAARMLSTLEKVAQTQDVTDEQIKTEVDKARKALETFYKDYHQPVDRAVFVKMLESYRKAVPEDKLPSVFGLIAEKYKGEISQYADDVFGKSIFASKSTAMNFLDKFKANSCKKLHRDPGYDLASTLFEHYSAKIMPEISKLGNENDSLMRLYMKAQMDFEPERRFFPDANSTLRIAYGKVKPYYPRDAVFYKNHTTIEGVMEKEDPNIPDYVVDEKLKKLYHIKDYGRYGSNGTLPVCFIATNHTTGGNSGSPAFNADGHLVGLNFDRVWEGTMSDLMFDPDQCRNIMLDMRYCLFIIDKYAGASHLIDEMVIVE